MDLNVSIISTIDPNAVFLSSTRNFNTNIKLVNRYFSEGSIIDCDENGFGVNYTKENKLSAIEASAPITIKRHENNSTDFGKNIARIQSIINNCKKQGIKVIIVTMPVSSYYAQGVNQFKLNKIFYTCLELQKNNDNVQYINLFQDTRFTNDDFYDSDHLHSDGATKCTKIVNNFINDRLKK
jgi:RNase H-fold protein (predicted Holliday junction resolvase)